MPQASYGITLSVGGVSIQKTAIRTGDHSNTYEITLPAALAVGSWVKTDLDTAAGTFSPGHGQTTGVYDVYWDGGLRYGVTITVTGDTLALEGGTGTDFPDTGNLTVVACKQVSINTAIDGDAIEIIGFSLEYADSSATSVGHVDLQDSGPATIEEIDLNANVPLVYDIDGGATNVFTGNPIVATKASHNNTASSATLKICSLEDSTP
jgi:hypothetical protein